VRQLDRLRQSLARRVEELYRGGREAEEPALRRFLGGFRLAPLGRGEAELAGRWRRDFARRGVTLGQADCLIAAAAAGIGARLATGNPKQEGASTCARTRTSRKSDARDRGNVRGVQGA